MGRKTKVALTVGMAGVAAWAASKVAVKQLPRTSKKALAFENTVILAHRGGLAEAPENTMAAFSKSAELGVHGFAVDIRLTKDEEIIIFHDEDLERTTNLTGKVADYSMNELQYADAGYYFKHEDGSYPYRGKGEKIITLRKLLEEFPQLLLTINLMDPPNTYEGSLMPSKLWSLLESLNVEDRVVITSTYDEQLDRFNLYAQNRIATGAGNDEVKKAYAIFTSKFGHLYNPRADVFIIPEKIGVFPLNTKPYIHFLTQLNIAAYYNQVDNDESFIKLLNNGASGFITNNPAHAMELLRHNTAEQ